MLLDVLEGARRLGLLGPGPVDRQLEHAIDLAHAIGEFDGEMLDLGSGGGLPGLVLFDEWPRALARFFAGEIDAAAIEKIAAEADTPFEKEARSFDRDFYLGQAALIAGKNGDGIGPGSLWRNRPVVPPRRCTAATPTGIYHEDFAGELLVARYLRA